MPPTVKFAQKISPSAVKAMRSTPVPWGTLGYVTYKRTYSRLREDLGRTEEWADTVERCVNALLSYGMQVTQEEADEFAGMFHQLKAIPGGRMLWQLGTSTVEKIGAASTQNCFYTKVTDVEAFCFTFDMLMLGGGVGFSVLPSHVHKLPEVRVPAGRVIRRDDPDVDFVVPDNRQGWVELLRRTLNSYFHTGRGFTYSCHVVRGKGTRIKGFGGTASGPEELVKGINQICGVLDSRVGKHLRPIDALDVMNIIGSVVVAGNVRRSAQISLGHADDSDYLAAKNWSSGQVPNWRAMSNNSVYCSSIKKLPESFWAGYEGTGEPYGLINLDLMRKVGRLKDMGLYPDHSIDGVNPCGEQGLSDKEACCLAELVPANLKTRDEFVRAARHLYRVCKTCLQLPFAWAQTNEIVKRNQRMGIGMTGLRSPHNLGWDDFDAGYKAVREYDLEYSKQIKASPSVRITTQKPSGTLGLLPGGAYVLPAGLHSGYSTYFTRRIRFSAADPIVEACRKAGYHVEPKLEFDGTQDFNTLIVSFPCASAPGTALAEDTPVVDQLEYAKQVQIHWSDNNVSLTAYYRKGELPAVRDWLGKNYKDGVKTASFLLHSDHGFVQAPYEPITKVQYDEAMKAVRPIQALDDSAQWDMIDSAECAGGVCPVK